MKPTPSLVLALALLPLACGEEAPECPPPPAPPELTAPQVEPVTVSAHDVAIHIGQTTLHLREVRGRLSPTEADRPVAINAVQTWRGRVQHAEVGLSTEAFEALLSQRGSSGAAPIDGATVRSDGTRLTLSGKVRPGGAFLPLRFAIEAEPFAHPDGRLGVRAVALRLLGIELEAAMDRADVTLADLLTLDGQRGLSVEGDALLIDLPALAPKVHLEGHVSEVAVLPDGVAVVLTDGETPARPVTMAAVAEATRTPRRNAVIFDGADIRFGDIHLIDGHIEVEDLDQSDALSVDVATLSEQLRAGHTKSLPEAASVRLYVPDHDAFTDADLATPHATDEVARAEQAPQ